MKFRLLFGFALASFSLRAQVFPYALATEYNDSFRSWLVYAMEDETEVEGTLKIRWDARNDFTEWDYRVGEHFGEIKQKWRNNPNEWELRGDNRIVRMQTVFPDDPSQWRITVDGYRVTLRPRFGNRADEWELRDGGKTYGPFQMYVAYAGDPREWEITDDMDADLPFELRMALAFLVVYNSTPNE